MFLFLLVHINVTVQNQITTTIMFNHQLVKILILQHLTHHHFYKAYKKPLETQNTQYPSHQFILETMVKQTHYSNNKNKKKNQILVIMTMNSKLTHKSEVITKNKMCGMCRSALFSLIQTSTNIKKPFKSIQTAQSVVSLLNVHWNV